MFLILTLLFVYWMAYYNNLFLFYANHEAMMYNQNQEEIYKSLINNYVERAFLKLSLEKGLNNPIKSYNYYGDYSGKTIIDEGVVFPSRESYALAQLSLALHLISFLDNNSIVLVDGFRPNKDFSLIKEQDGLSLVCENNIYPLIEYKDGKLIPTFEALIYEKDVLSNMFPLTFMSSTYDIALLKVIGHSYLQKSNIETIFQTSLDLKCDVKNFGKVIIKILHFKEDPLIKLYINLVKIQ